MKGSQLLLSLRDSKPVELASGPDVVEVRLRLPARVLPDIKAVAAAEGLSMNALFAIAMDALLIEKSRKSINDVAPWFADYLRGGDRLKRNRAEAQPASDDDPDFT